MGFEGWGLESRVQILVFRLGESFGLLILEFPPLPLKLSQVVESSFNQPHEGSILADKVGKCSGFVLLAACLPAKTTKV